MSRNLNALTAKQKAALILWIQGQAENTETYSELATLAAGELGFSVTESNIQGWWNAVHGPRKVQKPAGPKPFADMLSDIDARVTAIDRRLTDIETLLTDTDR